jgi:anti-anti-sigma factor
MVSIRQDWSVDSPFSTWVDVDADPPTVGVAGEIDLATCAAFRDALDEALERGARTVVVDFTLVTFMGSIGIREIVKVIPRVDCIEIRDASTFVRDVLEAAGLDSRLVLTPAR